uniref:RNase H type-1 domain-containing protein n=1 Tax=Anopheles atroparvus TaxID=41427 RepID=A0AAG5DTQ8_ANOAO
MKLCLPCYTPVQPCFSNSGSSIQYDLSIKQVTQETPINFLPIIIPHVFMEKYNHINSANQFFTDGSRLNESTGFGVYHVSASASRRLQEPSSVFTAEMAAISFALGLIADMPAGLYYIFTDSLSSIEALRSAKPSKHPSYFLANIRELMNVLIARSYKITFVWVPSHCNIPGNEKADSLAKVGAQAGELFERQVCRDDLFLLVRRYTNLNWQEHWDTDDLGRWLHSIIPNVSSKAWFRGLNQSSEFIRVMSRLMSNHYRLDAHLHRIHLVDSNICSCGNGYEDIEHAVWQCQELNACRENLLTALAAHGRQPQVPVRDVLAIRGIAYMKCIHDFIKQANIRV